MVYQLGRIVKKAAAVHVHLCLAQLHVIAFLVQLSVVLERYRSNRRYQLSLAETLKLWHIVSVDVDFHKGRHVQHRYASPYTIVAENQLLEMGQPTVLQQPRGFYLIVGEVQSG